MKIVNNGYEKKRVKKWLELLTLLLTALVPAMCFHLDLRRPLKRLQENVLQPPHVFPCKISYIIGQYIPLCMVVVPIVNSLNFPAIEWSSRLMWEFDSFENPVKRRRKKIWRKWWWNWCLLASIGQVISYIINRKLKLNKSVELMVREYVCSISMRCQIDSGNNKPALISYQRKPQFALNKYYSDLN